MSRNENEDIGHLELPDPQEYKVWYIDPDGNALDSEPKNCCAKLMTKEGRRRYWVKMGNSLLYDKTQQADLSYNRRTNWKLKSVRKECFEYYMRYLKTNSKHLLHQAERHI